MVLRSRRHRCRRVCGEVRAERARLGRHGEQGARRFWSCAGRRRGGGAISQADEPRAADIRNAAGRVFLMSYLPYMPDCLTKHIEPEWSKILPSRSILVIERDDGSIE